MSWFSTFSKIKVTQTPYLSEFRVYSKYIPPVGSPCGQVGSTSDKNISWKTSTFSSITVYQKAVKVEFRWKDGQNHVVNSSWCAFEDQRTQYLPGNVDMKISDLSFVFSVTQPVVEDARDLSIQIPYPSEARMSSRDHNVHSVPSLSTLSVETELLQALLQTMLSAKNKTSQTIRFASILSLSNILTVIMSLLVTLSNVLQFRY